jgi:hypothetical protein
MGHGGEKATQWKMAMVATIAMGNDGGGAMDGGTAVQLRSAAPQLPWTAAMGNGGQMLMQLESMMAAWVQWAMEATVQWTAEWLKWVIAVALRGEPTTSQTRWWSNERWRDNHLVRWELGAQRGVTQQCLCQFMQQHNHDGQKQRRSNGRRDGGAIAECGAVIAMLFAAAMGDSGQMPTNWQRDGGNGRWWHQWGDATASRGKQEGGAST